jgi:hypothetical protein
VYLEGHDDDEERGIFTGDESREKLHNNYITATDDIQDLRHAIQSFFG